MAAAETARLIAGLELDNRKFLRGISSSMGAVSKFDKGLSRAGRGFGRLGGGLGKAGILAGGAIVAGLGASAKAAIDFQDAFQGVVKTVDEADLKKAGLSFDDLSNSIRAMSREMPNSAIELAGIAESAGALGVKGGDIESFTKQVAILASTTNVSADDAATALGQLGNVIGLQGPSVKDRIGDYQRFAAALVDLGNKGASTESQILEIVRRSGGAAKLMGIAKDATLGWSAAAANLGLNEELAGTALQNFFLKAGQNTPKLAKVAGVTAASFKKLFTKDASGALEMFLKKLGKMPKDARLREVQSIFGKSSGLTRLVLGLSDSVDKNLTPSLKDSVKAWKDATAAQVEFDKRNATVRSAITRLKNNVIDAAVSIGEGFAPAVGRAADKLATLLSDKGFRAQLQGIGQDIGKAIDGIDWNKLLDAAKGVSKAFQPALDIVLKIAGLIASLPPGVLGAGAGLVITDKVTGGAISGGLGDIFGGLGSTLAKNLAAKIPFFGAGFVQHVWVDNAGFGLPGGLPGGAGAGEGLGAAGKIGATAGAGIVITDMHQFNNDIADRLEASGTKFGMNAGAAFREQANKTTLWDNILQGLGLQQPKDSPATGSSGPTANHVFIDGIKGNVFAPLQSVVNGGRAEERSFFGAGAPKAPTTGFDSDAALALLANPIVKAQNDARASFEGGLTGVATGVRESKSATTAGLDAVKGTAATGLSNVNAATRSGLAGATGAVNTARSSIVGAIQSNRPIVTTNVDVHVTSSGVQKATTTSTRYGEQNGSAGGGGSGGHGGGQGIAG